MVKIINKNQTAWWQPAMEIFAQISSWIVAPLLAAIFLGRYLDDRFGTTPWWYIACVAVGFVITNVGLIVTTVRASRKMEKMAQIEKNKK